MSSKALSKKTFGIENQAWIESSKFVIFSIVPIRICLVLAESLFDKTKLHEYDIAVVKYLLLSIFCIECGTIPFLSFKLAPKHYRKIFIANFIYSFFLTFYFFNPFIFEYIRLAENATKKYKYSLFFHFFSIPTVLANCYFITYVLWRMSKVKPDYDGDEPYLVIYGGEGSVIKKTEMNSE